MQGVPSAAADAEPSNMKNLDGDFDFGQNSKPVTAASSPGANPDNNNHAPFGNALLRGLEPAPDSAVCPLSNITNRSCPSSNAG